ncbi:6-phosphogluconolactonase [Thorsellia kenyensis]|uniref:6-phosphogluconolactonase n=1 Tax=Thorsellia kenyensis TaxID=1549888 RepID=A0ABV6C6S9_9GAMM
MHSKFFSDRDALSLEVAKLLLSKIPEETVVNVLISAGTMPMQVYEHMVTKLKQPQYAQVNYFVADEIPVNAGDVSMLTYARLRDRFFIPAQIPMNRIHPLSNANIKEIDDTIAKAGGLDIALLSMESDGHIAANLPGSSFESESREVKVDKSNPNIVNALQERIGKDLVVPDSVFTIGMKTIKKAKTIILVAVGDQKANAVLYLMKAPLSESLPASILHLHQNCHLMLDAGAAKGIHG